jgi:hypothetical protein
MSAEDLQGNVEEMRGKLELGGGAQLWAYVSGQCETPARVTKWSVRIEQVDGNWTGTIASDDPHAILQTPDLSGTFSVEVTASGPEFGETKLEPLPESKAEIGCNSNCAAMVGIVASTTATGANYWTVWDAFCKRSEG